MVNMRWAREAGFTTGFVLVILTIALRSLHVQVGTVAVLALLIVWACLFALFYQIAKRRHP